MRKQRGFCRRSFFAGWADNAACLRNIKEVFEKTSSVMDPHTSVAQLVAEKYLQETSSDIPVLICSTAHWAKFGGAVYEALTGKKGEDEFAVLEEISRLTKSSLPKQIMQLADKQVRFAEVCEAEVGAVEEVIAKFIKL